MVRGRGGRTQRCLRTWPQRLAGAWRSLPAPLCHLIAPCWCVVLRMCVQEEPGPSYATWLLPPEEAKVELRRQHVSGLRVYVAAVWCG